MSSLLSTLAVRWLPALLLLALLQPALAERADRTKPMTLESDKPCTVDLARQVSVCSGNVVIAQGTLVIRADRVELRETSDGYRSGTAWGAAGQPVRYRQKRDGSDEHLEGVSERMEFDGRSETLRLIGSAAVRRMRGSETVDEITGALITWNQNAELFSVQGGSPSADNPSGRVRAVLSPRAGAASAAKDSR